MSTSMASELFRKGNSSGASFEARPVPAPTGSRPAVLPLLLSSLGQYFWTIRKLRVRLLVEQFPPKLR